MWNGTGGGGGSASRGGGWATPGDRAEDALAVDLCCCPSHTRDLTCAPPLRTAASGQILLPAASQQYGLRRVTPHLTLFPESTMNA